jgi:hypothetical protein
MIARQDRENAERVMEAFCQPDKVRKKSTTIPNSRWDKAVRGAKACITTGDWTDAKPLEFVALYEMLHTRVYRVAPVELGSAQRMRAMAMAVRLLAQFTDTNEMAAFFRWVWLREEKREAWRKQTGASGGRISWYLQFDGRLVTDWRLERNRASDQKKAV